jgi:hypothetical protein
MENGSEQRLLTFASKNESRKFPFASEVVDDAFHPALNLEFALVGIAERV